MGRSNGIVTESTKENNQEYRDNFDKIFNKKKEHKTLEDQAKKLKETTEKLKVKNGKA